MYGAKFVWILLGYMERDWWLVNDSSITCSSKQLLKALDGHLATDFLWTTHPDAKIVSGKVCAECFLSSNFCNHNGLLKCMTEFPYKLSSILRGLFSYASMAAVSLLF